MLSLFPVACSKFGASSLKAEVSATDVNTLISAALLATAANKYDINPPAAISAMRFANDVWIMHPSHEINFSYSINSSAVASFARNEDYIGYKKISHFGSKMVLFVTPERASPISALGQTRHFWPRRRDHSCPLCLQ